MADEGKVDEGKGDKGYSIPGFEVKDAEDPTIQGMLEELDREGEIFTPFPVEDKDSDLRNARPTKRFLDLVLFQAVNENASDIVFQLNKDEFQIKYAVDGNYYEMAPPPRMLYGGISEEIELMFGIKKEVRVPQTWRQRFSKKEPQFEIVKGIDFSDGDFVSMDRAYNRIQTNLNLTRIETAFGKQYQIKAFYPSKMSGIDGGLWEKIDESFKARSGMWLIAAERGMGKTTLAYQLIMRGGSPSDLVIAVGRTYVPSGVQTIEMGPSNPRYADAVRNIRQFKPTIVSFDDISDPFTAGEALGLASSGTLVLASVGAFDAAAGVEYMKSLKVNPDLFARNLRGVIAQSLVGRIHPDCKVEFASPSGGEFNGEKLSYGKGCGGCNEIGYKGRVPVIQLVERTSAVSLAKEESQQVPRFYEIAKPLVERGVTTNTEYERLKRRYA